MTDASADDVIITIVTDTGPHDIRGAVIGDDILAVHETISRKLGAALFTLSHLPTGYAVIRGDEESVLVRIGETLLSLVPDVLALTDPKQIEAQMPKPIVKRLGRCHREGWTEPPSLNGDQESPRRMKMGKTKEQLAQEQPRAAAGSPAERR